MTTPTTEEAMPIKTKTFKLDEIKFSKPYNSKKTKGK